jgi:hypothetical protein
VPKQSFSPEIESNQVLDILGDRHPGLESRFFGGFLDAGINPEGKDDLGPLRGVAGLHASTVSPRQTALYG